MRSRFLLDEDGLGLGDLVRIDLAALHSRRANEVAGTAEVLQVDRNGPLFDAGEPVRMARNVLHIFAEGGILIDGEARDPAHSAGLDHSVAEVRCLDELGGLQQQTVGVGGDQQPAAIRGNMDGGKLGAGVHDVGIDGLFGQRGGAAESRARRGQLDRTVRVHLQSQRVTGAVQTVGHQMAGDALSVEAVDDLIDSLVLVDVHGEQGGVAAGLLCALLLVVVVHDDFGIADRDLDRARLRAALIAVVADNADFLDQRCPQLDVYDVGVTDSRFVCHKISFLLFDLDAGVHLLERGHDRISGVTGQRVAMLCAGGVSAGALRGITERPRICLCGIVQRLRDVGGTVLGAFECVEVQQSTDGFDAPALFAENGNIQRVVKGGRFGLRLHVGFQLGQLGFIFLRAFLAVELCKAVLRGLELGFRAVQLGLQGGGSGLFAVDVRAVLAHQPVQLLIGDAGDMILHIFTFHGG
nr:MAG TPA_asm: hypothetical protein [Caudoviricetes sp.]